MEHDFLKEIVLILGVSVAAAYGMRALRVPVLTGFILAGMLVGPGGLGLVAERHSIEVLAEAGVILLLFTVGLKLSLRELGRLKSFIFGSGTLQVVLTTFAAAGLARVLGLAFVPATIWGLLIALSSTALVLNVLEERAEEDTAHGRWMLGVLIFQDLAVVPILIALPLLASMGEVSWTSLALPLGKTLGILVAVVLGAHVLFPRLTEAVVRVRSREVFTLTALLVAFGTAWLVAQAGLSMAIGAFLAGVVLSESAYAQQILAEIAPLRDAFNSLFFVSVGMLVEPARWIDEPVLAVSLFLAVLVIKGVLIALLAFASYRSWSPALLAASGLAHVGEFSFVVAGAALGYGLLTDADHRLFLAVSVPTMLIAPLLLSGAAWIVRREDWAPPRVASGLDPQRAIARAETGGPHVVIVGFGVNGSNVARVLRLLEIPYVVLELNPATVRRLRAAGEPVLYGDAAREPVLRRAGIERARALVVAIADAAGSRQIVAVARKSNPHVRIIVRTRYVHELEPLHRLGADDVVPEEFETSLELAGRVLATCGAPAQLIEREKARLRAEQYGVLVDELRPARPLPLRELLADTVVQEMRVAENSRASGQSLRQLELRRRTGVSVVAVRRSGTLVISPEPDFELAAGDEIHAIATGAALESARALFEQPASG